MFGCGKSCAYVSVLKEEGNCARGREKRSILVNPTRLPVRVNRTVRERRRVLELSQTHRRGKHHSGVREEKNAMAECTAGAVKERLVENGTTEAT